MSWRTSSIRGSSGSSSGIGSGSGVIRRDLISINLRRHDDEFAGDVDVQLGHQLHVPEVLLGDARDREVPQVHLGLADEVEQQVERAAVGVEFDFIIEAIGHDFGGNNPGAGGLRRPSATRGQCTGPSRREEHSLHEMHVARGCPARSRATKSGSAMNGRETATKSSPSPSSARTMTSYERNPPQAPTGHGADRALDLHGLREIVRFLLRLRVALAHGRAALVAFGHPAADLDGVNPFGGQGARGLAALAEREAVLDEVLAVELDGDGQVRPGGGARAAERLDHEAAPALRRAAPFIGAAVGVRREEFAEQVAVGAVELDAVEAGLARAAGGLAEGVERFLDLARGHLARADSAADRARPKARSAR